MGIWPPGEPQPVAGRPTTTPGGIRQLPGENVVESTPTQNVATLCWAASTFLGSGDLSVPRRKGEGQALKVL